MTTNKEVTLDKDDRQNKLLSYNIHGTINLSSGGLLFLKDEARDKINAFILEIANNPDNRREKS